MIMVKMLLGVMTLHGGSEGVNGGSDGDNVDR